MPSAKIFYRVVDDGALFKSRIKCRWQYVLKLNIVRASPVRIYADFPNNHSVSGR